MVSDLTSWTVTLVNKTGAPLDLTGVRWRVVVPRWDQASPLASVPAASRDAAESYGAAFTASVLVDGSDTRTFGDGLAPRRVPNGRRTLILIDELTGTPHLVGTPPHAVHAEIELSRKLSPHEIRIEVR